MQNKVWQGKSLKKNVIKHDDTLFITIHILHKFVFDKEIVYDFPVNFIKKFIEYPVWTRK